MSPSSAFHQDERRDSSSIDVLPNGPRLSCGALKKTHPIIYARLLKRLLGSLGWTKTVKVTQSC